MSREFSIETNNLIEEFVNANLFRRAFHLAIESEVSPFGKIILQENLISEELILFIKRARLLFLSKVQDNFADVFYDIEKDLQGMTLKSLQKTAVLFFDSRSRKLNENLSEYITLRNKLTHKMLVGKYKKIEEVYVDAKIATKLGEIVLIDLRELGDGFINAILK